MADPRIEKFAQILVDHSARIQPGDRVAIEATTAAEPLVRAIYGLILERGGHPHLLLDLPDQDEILYARAISDAIYMSAPLLRSRSRGARACLALGFSSSGSSSLDISSSSVSSSSSIFIHIRRFPARAGTPLWSLLLA